MRIGTKTSDPFIQELNEKFKKIQDLFLIKIKSVVEPVPIKVMLGDNTISEEKTFDPKLTQEFFENVIKNFPNWDSDETQVSQNEDIRRVFTKFATKIDSYIISGHLSLQFHVLLFYKPTNKVTEYKKELSEILDKTKTLEENLKKEGDLIVLEKLKELGYSKVDEKNLFEIFFENEKLADDLYKQAEDTTDFKTKDLMKRKMELFDELNNLLMETYQTTPVLIDEARLVTGEEGCLFTLDLDFSKNNIKESNFEPRKISNDTKIKIKNQFDGIIKFLQK